MNEPKHTAQAPRPGTQPGGSSLKLGDIYYVLFRRKWVILSFLLIGTAASVAFYLLQKPVYFSEAKLLVRYIIDTKQVAGAVDTQVRSPSEFSGESIINSE